MRVSSFEEPETLDRIDPHGPIARGSKSEAVRLEGITKGFFGALANDKVNLELRWGEVHGLLGENGAGKSTLCSVMAGLYKPDGGEIRIGGEVVEFRSPHDALQRGVGMVYQHFRLVNKFTVAENLALGHPETSFVLPRHGLEQRVEELGERYGLAVQAEAAVGQLSVGEQQRVEILKLLHRGVEILVLDEPTAVLTPLEARRLFSTLRAMADEGKVIVFVSHKLDEVMDVCDRVTVLRGGKNSGSMPVADATPTALAQMMIGRALIRSKRRDAEPGEPVLSVTGLRADGDRGSEAVTGVDIEVRAGQIVGIAGVSGNGQHELAEVISGLRAAKSGQIVLGGVDVTQLSVLDRIELGLGFVPEDRLGTGLAPGLSLAKNLSLKSYRWPPLSKGSVIQKGSMKEQAEDLVKRFDIRGDRPGLPVSLLSGGNLQRAILAREVSATPKVLLAAAPTRGLDVAAIQVIRQLLLDVRDKGAAILMISEDLEEVMALSDEILVMFEGGVIGRLEPDQADPEVIGLLMAGHKPAPV